MKFCIKSLLKFKVSYVLRAGQLRFACGATGSLEEIAEGNKAADKAAASIETVVEGIGKIAESSKNISQVSRDQATAMDQAEQGVNQISEVVQANSATAQESSATSEELSAQAVSLDELISKYILPQE